MHLCGQRRLYFLRRFGAPAQCRVVFDVVVLSSYRGRASTGKVKVVKKLSRVIKNRHVLIVEDIIDSGLTMNTLQTIIKVKSQNHC